MRLVSVKVASEILTAFEIRHGRKPVSERHVRYLIDVGRLPAHKVPGTPKRGPKAGLKVRLNWDFLNAA